MADNIKYDSSSLQRWARDLSDVSSALANAKATLNRVDTSDFWWGKVKVKSSLNLRDAGTSYALGSGRDAIKDIKRALGDYETRVSRLSGKVSDAVERFDEAEADVGSILLDVGMESGDLAKDGSWSPYPWDKLIRKFVSSFNIPGGILGSWMDVLASKDGYDYVKSVGKAIVKTGEKVVKWIDLDKRYTRLANIDKDWANDLRNREFLGRDRYLKNPSKSANKWTAFGTNFGNTFKKCMKNSVAWVTSGIESGVNNFKEWKSGAISGDRAGVEWAVETVSGVALAAGATALTAAVLTTAPAWGVAAVSGALVVGADWICKNTIGKSTVDGVPDRGVVELVGHTAGNMYDGGKKMLQNLGNWFGQQTKAKSTGRALASW